MKKKELRLLQQSSLKLFSESRDLADFAADVIQDVRKKLTLSIQEAAGTDLENSVTMEAMADLVRELDKNLNSAKLALQGHSQKVWIDGYQTQFEGLLEQVTTFEKVAASGLPEDAILRIAKLKPRINGALIKGVFEGSLNELSGSLSSLKEPIRKMIASNILTGGSYSDLIHDIKGLGISKGPFVSVEARARAIAITETTNVYNFARYEAIEGSNRTLQDSQKIDLMWHALLDGKTSNRCRSLNGQVRKQGQNFKAADGWEGKKPAAHPHCRSEVRPYRKAWQAIFDDFEKELENQVKR